MYSPTVTSGFDQGEQFLHMKNKNKEKRRNCLNQFGKQELLKKIGKITSRLLSSPDSAQGWLQTLRSSKTSLHGTKGPQAGVWGAAPHRCLDKAAPMSQHSLSIMCLVLSLAFVQTARKQGEGFLFFFFFLNMVGFRV